MRFTERSFSVVILAAVILITLCSGLSCAAQAPEPAPVPEPVPAPAPAPESQANLNPDAPVVLKLVLPSEETVTTSKNVRVWFTTPIECVVEGNDAENLKYHWTASGQTKLWAEKGSKLEDDSASRVNWMSGVSGDYTVDVVVTDNSSNKAKGTVNFKVICCDPLAK